jgi:acetyl esterase/lipase
MKIMALLAVMTNILSVGCARAGVKDTVISDLPSSSYQNVAYGPDPKQVMDIYLPQGRTTTSTKVLFLIHGGSWSGGDKYTFQGYVDSLKKFLPDYALVNVNYRLANFSTNKFPTQENDVKAAITQVMDRADEYQVSKNIVLLGASAGAHLALLHAYKYTEPAKPLAVISFFGPTDIEDLYNFPAYPQVPQLLELLLGGSPTSNPTIYKQSSPVTFITSESCPTLLFQGGKDLLVTPKQSALLKDKLTAAGVVNELIVYPNEGHGWHGNNLGDSFQKITRFLSAHVDRD